MTENAVIPWPMEGRGFSPAASGSQLAGPLGPEAVLLQGLKPQESRPFPWGGLKPRPSLELHRVQVLDVQRVTIPVERDDDGQAYRGLGRRHYNHEKGEQLAVQISEIA